MSDVVQVHCCCCLPLIHLLKAVGYLKQILAQVWLFVDLKVVLVKVVILDVVVIDKDGSIVVVVVEMVVEQQLK